MNISLDILHLDDIYFIPPIKIATHFILPYV